MGTSAVRFESSVCPSLCKSRWGKLSSRISCRGSTYHCRTTWTWSIRCCFTSREYWCWSQDHVLPKSFSQRRGSTCERNRKLNTRISGKPCVVKSSCIRSRHLSKIEWCQGSRWLHRRGRNVGMASSNTRTVALLCSFLIVTMLNTGFVIMLLWHGRSSRCPYTRTFRLYCVDISDAVPWICSQRMVLRTYCSSARISIILLFIITENYTKITPTPTFEHRYLW